MFCLKRTSFSAFQSNMMLFYVQGFIYFVVISTCFDYSVNSTTIASIEYMYSSTEFIEPYCHGEEPVDAANDLYDILYDLELLFDEKTVNDTSDAASPIGNTFINQLKQQYINIEQLLWSIIIQDNHLNAEIDEIDLLELVRVSHAIFLNGNFRENVIDLNLFDAHDEILYESILTINQSLRTAQKTYLNDPTRLDDPKNELNIMLIVQDQLILRKTLDNIYEYISSNDDYMRIKAQLKQCDKNVMVIKSANQLIYEYYHDISTAELKAYALVQLAYMFYTVYNRGNFRGQAQALRTKYLDRTHHTQDIVRHLLEYSKRDIWRCDPNHYSVGTYEEVTNFLVGYFDNEVNLNPDGTCQNTCEDYRVTKNYQCYDGTYCGLKPEGAERDRAICKGDIVDCQFLGSDLNICSTPNQASRRYDVLYYDNGNVLGRNGTQIFEKCADESTRVQSWIRWVVKCTNCFCLCDDQKHSERHFSLRDVVSDIYKNRVVSALAFRKFQGVFHLMIVERELKPYAALNVTNPTWHMWSKVDYFHIHDALVREGIDYHTMTWENRSINLDTVEVPSGKVVTGCRFRVVNGVITLQVRATDFDFISGRLKNLESSFWYVSEAKERTQIPLDNLDVPTLTPEKSIPNILKDRYIKFGPTDKFKDLSQTTIPFIDSQLVESHNPMPLSGVGLYYKTFPGYGGFIAPKILNYNFGPHIGALSSST